MRIPFLTTLACGVGLFALCGSAFGHHGTFVSYDPTKIFTTKATVTEFRYTNPHIQLFFDIKDDKGNVTHWSAEGPDPAVLVAVGWGRKKTINALVPGTEITITLQPARNGKPVAEMSNIVLANGDMVCGLSGARTGNCAGGDSKPGGESK
jgi:uncharacterized protein DUF6152